MDISILTRGNEMEILNDEIVFSLVVPFYNEAESLESVCREIYDVLNEDYGSQWELIMVNDGSTDMTPELMDTLAKRFSVFRSIHLKVNSGQSAALHAGFCAARGRIIGTMDGDGQNDPRDFARLIADLEANGADMMCGIREQRFDSALRRFSSWLANRVRSFVLKDGVRDIGCSIRVFHRRCLDQICFFHNGHRFFPVLVKSAGCRVQEMPVRHRPRLKGISRYGLGIHSRLFAGIFDLFGVYWLCRRRLRYAVVRDDRPQT